MAEKITGWRTEAATVIGTRAVDHLETAVATPPPSVTPLAELPIEALAASVVDVVSTEKATWTRWNLIAETERQLRPLRFPTPGDRETATRLVLDRALHSDHAVQLTPDGLETDLAEA